MVEIKTKKNDASVEAFLQTIKEEEKIKDCAVVLKMMKQITKQEPKMWGSSIVGFGSFHYKSERSKQEGDWFMIGFSPRKQNLTIYIISGFDLYMEQLKNLGKHTTSVSCLYVKRLSDINIKVLEELVSLSFKHMKEKYKK